MTTNADLISREAFEAWYANTFLTIIPLHDKSSYFNLIDGDYVSLHCAGAWEGWKANAQKEQEPVAKVVTNGSDVFITTPKGTHFSMVDYVGCEFYTTPPNREWVGLAKQQLLDCIEGCETNLQLAYAIEAKIKELNHANT